MRFFTLRWRALLLSAVLAVSAVWWAGCGDGGDPASGGGGSINYGTLTDDRDGQTYKTIVIGSQTWMAENMNFKTTDSWCYGDNANRCNKYGRLYAWSAAKSVCPIGWRLPDTADWRMVIVVAGGANKAGKKLKSTSGWYDNGNGTDEFGFSALPGGTRGSDGHFYYADSTGYWWATAENGNGEAYGRIMDYDGDRVYEYRGYYNYGFSVRCVKNE